MPREVFVAGQILTAAEMNVVSDQTVMSFAGTAARGSAIASPTEGMVTYLEDVNRLEAYTGAAFVPVNTAFTAGTTITASGTAISVPTLGAPIVRVTVIGGGGGGGAAQDNNGGTGGTTTFDAGGGGTVSAAGGLGGYHGNQNIAGRAGTLGSSAGNGGMGAVRESAGNYGSAGLDGAVTVAYLNLTGVSTFTVTVGAGGTGGAAGAIAGGAGGRGEARLEYVAG